MSATVLGDKMRRQIRNAWIAGLALMATAASAAPPPANPNTAIAIMQASAALQNGDCAGAMPALTRLWDDATLAASDPELAGRFRFQRVGCTAQISGLKPALELSAENLTRAPVTADAYDMHIFLLLMDKQTGAAAAALDTALARFKDRSEDLSDSTVIGVMIDVSDQPAVAGPLLNHMEEAHWQVHAPAFQPLISYWRLQGLRHAVAIGDPLHAALYRADLETDALAYVVSQGDATISDASVTPKAIGPVIQKQIDELKAWVGANPDDLMALSYLVTLERTAGQNDLALTQINGIFTLVDKYGLDKFKGQENYGQLLIDKAELLADLGKPTDAIAAYEAGTAKLSGSAQGDMYLSYMNFLIDSGHDAQGLALAGRIDGKGLNDEQKANFIAQAACAYGYTGNTQAYGAAMAILGVQTPQRIKAAMCAGRPDDAAGYLIAALGVPDMRDALIHHMQAGVPAIPLSARDQAVVTAYAALKNRADVERAVKAAQIIVRKWPLRF